MPTQFEKRRPGKKVKLVPPPGSTKEEVAAAALLQAALSEDKYPLTKLLRERVLPYYSEAVAQQMYQQDEEGDQLPWSPSLELESLGLDPEEREDALIESDELKLKADQVKSEVENILSDLNILSGETLRLTLEGVLPTLACATKPEELPWELAYLLRAGDQQVFGERLLRKRLYVVAPKPGETPAKARARMRREAAKQIDQIIEAQVEHLARSKAARVASLKNLPRARREAREFSAQQEYFRIFLLNQYTDLSDATFLGKVAAFEDRDVKDAISIVSERTGISAIDRELA